MTISRSDGALRNVGELASPYYLLELWAKRDDINIDPETFATLKVKVRHLLRDARAFEGRGEPPDDEWLWRRRDLVAATSTVDKFFPLDDGSDFELKIWRDIDGMDCLVLGELPNFSNPDTRREDEADPFSTRFELALEAYGGDADWGLLLSWPELRVYRRASGISQQYLGLNLEKLVELNDEANWRAFAAIFRTPAFVPDAQGVPLVRRVVDESRRHASALVSDMRSDVVVAAEALIRGALTHPSNVSLGQPPPLQTLQRLFEETLYYLYRLLFILYAEARDVLPVSGGAPYATTYSVDHLVERARQEPELAHGDYYSSVLRTLFRLLWAGPPQVTGLLGFQPVGGELFDPSRTALLDSLSIDDADWRTAVQSIALGAHGSTRWELGRRSSFAELDVDQLGSIYEGLLVLEPYLADGPRVIVRDGQDRRVVEPGGEGGLRVVGQLRPGDFVLESASGRRKGSGSFYTPAEITEYLAHAALDPLVAPILARAEWDPDQAALDILALKVCDPAMGSGAFLVQAARVLGRSLARVRAMKGDGRVTPEMVRRAERGVIRSCLYGVDLNPLAVTLAKVSLWLETLEVGRPLSFLDAHLRVGDSLVGVEFLSDLGTLTPAQLAAWPKGAAKGLHAYLVKEGGQFAKPLLAGLKKRTSAGRAVQAQLPGLDMPQIVEALKGIVAAREDLEAGESDDDGLQLELALAQRFRELEGAEDLLRNRLREAADFWCAQWFSDGEDVPEGLERTAALPIGEVAYHEIVARLISGETTLGRHEAAVCAARAVAARRHFFHWALEFPEVILKRGGFDAVIGNPPWNTLSPDTKEFFSTYDNTIFRKGVQKAIQAERKADLRADPDIDAAWRSQARFLYELSWYAKPESGRFAWYAADGQLRKGDANVFRLFVERAYGLLRSGGRLAQVLPDSVYVSSPATGVRQRLLTEGQLERCYVFENRRGLFPIDSRIKIVLLTARRGNGPTERFAASFLTGKDAAGRERAISLEELPLVLATLDLQAPELTVAQVRALAPETWSFPELQTALDAEIAEHCARTVPPLNLDARGWAIRYSRGLHSNEENWRFKSAVDLEALGAIRTGLRWLGPEGQEWWPLVEGQTFYHLEFPQGGRDPRYWVNGGDVARIPKFLTNKGTSVFLEYRVAWRDTASATNERSAIAAVLPPRTAEKDTAPSVWGGVLAAPQSVALAAVISSFVFDYLIRFGGKTHLKHYVLDAAPVPPFEMLEEIIIPAAEVICLSDDYEQLWKSLFAQRSRMGLDSWAVGERRSQIDARVAVAYGLSLDQFAALLSTFPNLDTVQPALPSEPKSFVTRDLALLAYCQEMGQEPRDIVDILAKIKVALPMPRPGFRRIDQRVAAYRERGAVPYRPTPRGGRRPTDQELIDGVLATLTAEPQRPVEIAEVLEEDEKVIAQVLKSLEGQGEVFAAGAGRGRRYYVLEEE